MNKYGLAMGLVAAAAITGCLDPNYRSKRHREAGNVPAAPTNVAATPISDGYDTTPQDVPGATPVATATVTDEIPSTPSGARTIDATPSNYSDTTPVAPTTEPVPSNVAPVATPAAATTTYIVQPGDTLSKISKRYNIKLDAIRAANPQVKNDVIKVGRAITLPGSVDVGEQAAPAAAAPATPVSSTVKPYAGATQQHVVKSGESLGVIARKYKTTSAQLMQMNRRIKSANSIQAGWSLTVPAAAAAAATAVPAAPVTEAKPAPAKEEAPVQPAEVGKDDDIAAATAGTTVPAVEPAPAPAGSGDYFLYTVKPGEDITGIAINYDVPTSEILRLNGLAEGAQLTPGMEIKVPTAQ